MTSAIGSRTSRTGGRSSCRLLAVVALVTLPLVARAATDYPLPARQKGVNNAVKAVPATPERIAALRVPAGFALNVFARDLVNPRMIAVAADGTVYVTQQRAGSVLLLRDRDGDGVADERREVVGGIHWVHGITTDGGTMYLASTLQVLVAELQPDGGVGEPRVIIDDLAPGGRHENRTLAVGPDRKLYIDVGSTCNACIEENPRNGTMLRGNLDGSDLRIIMRGLRNTTGFGWHPVTHALWGMDHGIDWLGDTIPLEELNRLVDGADYGWPFCWGKQQVAAIGLEPPHVTAEGYCRKTRPMVLGYDAHASPIGMIFYTGTQFPAAFRNDAFITMRGSWNRRDPRGYEVVRVRFDAAGNPVRFEPFVTGFLVDDGTAQFGRLAGIAMARDGALLFTDDENGVMYRVAYRGDAPSPR